VAEATKQTIFLAGGGTGGHLYPGIAVAQSLRTIRPDLEPVFLCTEREIDKVILEPTGFASIPQPIVPPHRSVGGLLRFWKGWRETKDLVAQALRDRHPVAVVGLGGYAAGAAVKLAALRGIPTTILNPDVIPGKANQYLMRYVQTVCCQFDQTRAHVSTVHHPKLRTTGCPIRPDIRYLPTRDQALGRLSLERNLSTLVVTGASLGAQTVNQAVLEVLRQIKLQGWQILHLCGRDHGPAVRAAYHELDIGARIIDFTPEMADVWAVADLAISRAGASSCAELTSCGVPSLLMPYPFHRDMHQRANAQVLTDAGAAIMIDDEKDAKKNAARLGPAVQSLLHDADRRRAMGDAARALGRPDAADRVARLSAEMIGG
jgi:UDP-N-acetylglucosamine--N-acetylmuramyl-(pentapeptide) pyrophosphoryl-undecaprenol N-acetylglucosamine transferase